MSITYASDLIRETDDEILFALQDYASREYPIAIGEQLVTDRVRLFELLRLWRQPKFVRIAGLLTLCGDREHVEAFLEEYGLRLGSRVSNLASNVLHFDAAWFSHAVAHADEPDVMYWPKPLASGLQLSCNRIEESQGALLVSLANHLLSESVVQGKARPFMGSILMVAARLRKCWKWQPLYWEQVLGFYHEQHRTIPILTARDEASLVNLYLHAGSKLHSRDLAGAASSFQEVLSTCPWFGEARVLAAYVASQQGRRSEARMLLNEGLSCLSHFGVALDKRLDYDEWLVFLSWIEAETSGRPSKLDRGTRWTNRFKL